MQWTWPIWLPRLSSSSACDSTVVCSLAIRAGFEGKGAANAKRQGGLSQGIFRAPTGLHNARLMLMETRHMR